MIDFCKRNYAGRFMLRLLYLLGLFDIIKLKLMAKPNILVISIVFCGFTVQLINTVIFFIEIPYWFGYIWNTIGFYFSIALFIKAECVQGVWYNEVYESEKTYNDFQDVIELTGTKKNSLYTLKLFAMDKKVNPGILASSMRDTPVNQMTPNPMSPTPDRKTLEIGESNL
jgi:hypothetical protein